MKSQEKRDEQSVAIVQLMFVAAIIVLAVSIAADALGLAAGLVVAALAALVTVVALRLRRSTD